MSCAVPVKVMTEKPPNYGTETRAAVARRREQVEEGAIRLRDAYADMDMVGFWREIVKIIALVKDL